jgi:RND family efflux transporter MFP subunit
MRLKNLLILILTFIVLLLIYWWVQKPDQDSTRPALKTTDLPVSVAIARKQKLVTNILLSGTVNSGPKQDGTIVDAGAAGSDITDNSIFTVNVYVPEREAFKLKAGDKVEVTADLYPQYKYTGRIEKIAAKLKKTRTYPVDILVSDNSEFPLQAGISVQVSFMLLTPDEALTIPRPALIGNIKNAKVYRIKKGVANLRTVIIGRQSTEFLEVLNGISRGDTIVVAGQENLMEGSKVKITNQY